MSKIKCIEDLFIEFYDLVQRRSHQLQYFDQNPAYSFYIALLSDKPLTKNQGNYLFKLLKKYKSLLELEGHDVDTLLSTLPWKKSFRTIDNSKKISIEFDEDNIPWIHLQFPFGLKQAFDQEFSDQAFSQWDNERKVRKIPLYHVNFLKIETFIEKNDFELDQSFLDYKDQIDDIWQNYEDYCPYSEIVDNTVILRNANEEATAFWNENKTGNTALDLLSAREMGFYLKKDRLENAVEKIAASSKNLFWTKGLKDFFEIYKSTDAKVCLILDRSSDYFSWLKFFTYFADEEGVSRKEIKVCFREDGKSNNQVNQWIKENQVGGKISDGRIFIFLNSPAKWLYKDLDSFKIIATNGLFPFTSKTLQCLLNHHPCVINISETKPSKQRDIEIEEL
jgi:hypothetical protein